MTRIGPPAPTIETGVSVFHEGERAVQLRVGVDADARRLGRGISPVIPDGARPFLAAQRLAVLAGLDEAGRVWAAPVSGAPGFITAPSSRTLRLAAGLPTGDPLAEALTPGRPLGALVFDPERRRRLRINGRVTDAGPDLIEIQTDEVFGNCPKYIQAREPAAHAAPSRPGAARRARELGADQRGTIERADTMFIASVHAGTGADASHRGGQPSFVRVVDARTLRLPDYPGNHMFQTLGNITTDPRVGLLFVDFDTGTTLQLTGRARILWDHADYAAFTGAERALEVGIEESVEIAGRGPLGWRFVEYSPFNPR